METYYFRFKDDENKLTKTLIEASGKVDAMNKFRSIYPTNLLYYCINNNELELNGTPED